MSRRPVLRRSAEPRRLPGRYVEAIDRVAEEIRRTAPEADLRDWLEGYWQTHRGRLATDLWMVDTHLAHDATVLECGAVPLLLTGALQATGVTLHAVDVAPQRFAGAVERLGVDVQTCDIERRPLPFDDGTFDGVLFNELFEHLRIDPIFTLRQVLRVLKPGGQLLLSTPNLRSFRGLRNLILHDQGHAVSADIYAQYEKLETLGHMGHVREYTTRDVADFLRRIGFEVEMAVYRGGHGRGIVGLAERLAPSLRPFVTLVARRPSETV